MSNDTAAALRRLAELVEKDPSITAMVEVETIGRMVKTSVVLWSVAPGAVVEPPKPEVRWCQARRLTATGRAACGAGRSDRELEGWIAPLRRVQVRDLQRLEIAEVFVERPDQRIDFACERGDQPVRQAESVAFVGRGRHPAFDERPGVGRRPQERQRRDRERAPARPAARM